MSDEEVFVRLEALYALGEQYSTRTEADDLFFNSSLAWVKTPPSWRLALGRGEFLMVFPHKGAWTSALIQGRKVTRLLEAASPPRIYEAAEEYAGRSAQKSFILKTASWRSAPASEPQRAALRRMKVYVPSELSKGEAAALITGHLWGPNIE
jgi:hypothetical protein